MNRIYRLVWNRATLSWVTASEHARGRGKGSGRSLVSAALSVTGSVAGAVTGAMTGAASGALTAALMGGLGLGLAHAGPQGGQVTAGAGSIGQSGATTTVTQSSQSLSVNWHSFNVGAGETVDFVQPGATAVAINRILGNSASQIYGHLDANGLVYLINPNGVVFGPGAQVNVGGLVASTLDLTGGAGTNSQSFSGTGAGSVINQGTIRAATGGTVALLGSHVANTGVISAQLGTVALGAGSAVTLNFNGNKLVALRVDQSVLDTLAANGGLIQADGGRVLMSAGARDALLASAVNNTGVIEARTVQNQAGTITLLGGMQAGTVNVGGTLDAGAPASGNGGSIETSAARVQVASTARVSTAAAAGLNGTWLIDPTDFTISAGTGSQSTSGIGASTLHTELANGNVAIVTSNAGTQSGDINVNAALAWSANKLTLTAANDINVNAVMTVSGTASLDLAPASNNVNMGFNADGTFAGRVDFRSSGVLRMNVGGTLQTFTVINSLGSASDASSGNAQTLQGMARAGNLPGYFALGSNIDATATASWNPCASCAPGLTAGNAGFTPVGNWPSNPNPHPFTGTFDGLGHTVNNLTVNQGWNENSPPPPVASSYLGLFGYGNSASVIRNVGMVNVSILGGLNAGGLVGLSYGRVDNSYSSGNVKGTQAFGGLIGRGYGTMNNDYSTANVGASGNGPQAGSMGGLVGVLGGSLSNSHASGDVTGSYSVGGLVGYEAAGSITKSYATGSVSGPVGSSDIGGLVGFSYGAITHSYYLGTVTGDTAVGGLVGANYGSITTSHAAASVSGNTQVGGFVGFNGKNFYAVGSIDTSNATGSLTATGNSAGGLVGTNYGSITASYAHASLAGADMTGGLVGSNGGSGTYGAVASIGTSFAIGSVSGARYTGGLIGSNYGAVTNTYSTASVSGSLNVGGLIGMSTGVVSNSYASGLVTGGNFVGALIGANFGTLTNGIYDSTANPSLTGIGGNGGGTSDVAGTVAGLNSANLQTQANFTSVTAANGSVNPGSTWVMYEAHTAPLLQVFMTPLTINGTVTQTYTGAGFAPSLGSLSYSLTPDPGHLFGVATIAGSATGALHAGTYSFTPGGLYSDQLGYIIRYTGGTLTIKPAPLTVSGTTVGSRAYNGSTTATLSGGRLVGLLGGDTLTLTQAGIFAFPGPGGAIAVTADDTISGAAAGDYILLEPTGLTGSIVAASNAGGAVIGGVISQVQSNLYTPPQQSQPGTLVVEPTLVVVQGGMTAVGAEAGVERSAGGDDSVITLTGGKAVAVNVNMMIGAVGTLQIQNGGMLLPEDLVDVRP
jgi:filamentous hemagglutinin family protein